MTSSKPHRWYSPSKFSTSTKTSSKSNPAPDKPPSIEKSRSQKAWQKTKKLLSSLGEPPTAEYDQQQLAAGKIEKSKTFRSADYGAYGGGGPYSGRI
jgi:hypothetical protein